MDQNLQGTFVQSGLCLFPPLPAVCPNDPPLCLANASPYWMPEPILSGSSSLKKNWMQLIPIEMTSSTSLYAEKYFGETFKKLSKQLLSFRFRTLFRSWQELFWSTWERPLPHFRLSLHSFQGKWGRFPGRTCPKEIFQLFSWWSTKWSKAWNITNNEMITISFRNFKMGVDWAQYMKVIWKQSKEAHWLNLRCPDILCGYLYISFTTLEIWEWLKLKICELLPKPKDFF